jgi:hypothetical protein
MTASPRPSESPDGGRPKAHCVAKESIAHQNVISNPAASFSSVEDQEITGDKVMTPDAALPHEGGQDETRSRCSARGNAAQGMEGQSASGGQRREAVTDSHDLATYVHGAGAGAPEDAKDKSKQAPKQYTIFWYCHQNCDHPGPWRSEIPRCLGCEHVRCDWCDEETVATRDPCAPPG